VACLAVGFAGGTWWGSGAAERRSSATPEAVTRPAVAPSAPAAVASRVDRAIQGEVTGAPVGQTASIDGTAAPAAGIHEDPQIALQVAAAESSRGAGEAVAPAPANTRATNEQSAMQPTEPTAPAAVGTGSQHAPPSASAQLSAQMGSVQ